MTLSVERLEESERSVTLRFSVTDTGIGMDEEQRVRIFQAFEQADASIARRFGGTGLGLAITSRLVALMGGRVGVESQPGRGSTFWFEVPLERQHGEAPAAEAAPADPELVGARVLVVEPSAAMRRSYVAEARRRGAAGSSRSATPRRRWRRCAPAAEADDPFRFALIERELPGMDGEDLGATHPRRRAPRPHAHRARDLGRQPRRRGAGARPRVRGLHLQAARVGPCWPAVLVEARRRAETAPAGIAPALVTLHSMAEAERGRLRILLVEDSAVNQLVTQWTLKRLGYGLHMAATAEAALEAWGSEPFDLVLLDLRLPDGDGFALAAELRAREAPGRRAPIVAMTGSAESGERERCLEVGMDEFLTKPVDLGLLCNVVERLTHDAGRGAAAAAVADDTPPSREMEFAAGDATLSREMEAVAGDAPPSREIEVVADDAPPSREMEAVAGDAPLSREMEVVADDAPLSREMEAVADDAPLSREIEAEAAEADICGLVRPVAAPERARCAPAAAGPGPSDGGAGRGGRSGGGPAERGDAPDRDAVERGRRAARGTGSAGDGDGDGPRPALDLDAAASRARWASRRCARRCSAPSCPRCGRGSSSSARRWSRATRTGSSSRRTASRACA